MMRGSNVSINLGWIWVCALRSELGFVVEHSLYFSYRQPRKEQRQERRRRRILFFSHFLLIFYFPFSSSSSLSSSFSSIRFLFSSSHFYPVLHHFQPLNTYHQVIISLFFFNLFTSSTIFALFTSIKWDNLAGKVEHKWERKWGKKEEIKLTLQM